MHGHFLGRYDAQAHLVAADFNHGDRDIVVDDNRLVFRFFFWTVLTSPPILLGKAPFLLLVPTHEAAELGGAKHAGEDPLPRTGTKIESRRMGGTHCGWEFVPALAGAHITSNRNCPFFKRQGWLRLFKPFSIRIWHEC
jgi:hypothetical protein